MALKSSKVAKSSGNRVEQPVMEADVYNARLVQLIDLGVQPQRAYQGKEKAPANEVMFTYELCDVFMVDEDGKELEDKPRWISETLPFFGVQADMAKSSKRYLAFDPTNEQGGDLSIMLDVPCNLTLVINAKGDKVYENIGNIAAMSAKKKAACPPLQNKARIFDFDEPDLEVFNSLPDWIKKKITEALNFKGSNLEEALGGAAAPKAEEKKAPRVKVEEADPEDDEDDENPY